MFFRLSRLFKAAGRDALVLWYACRDPVTPGLVKLSALLLAFYVVSPIDLVSDFLPVLGWMDDVTLLAIGIPAILKLMPQRALQDAHSATDRLLSRWRLGRR